MLIKRKLLIVGYYHLADGFRTCANYLKKEYDVYFFPLLHYHDSRYDVKNELIRYINGQPCEHYECGLVAGGPPIDVVLIWQFKYFIESHERLDMLISIKNQVNHAVTYMAFNWDPMPPQGNIDPLKLTLIRLMNCYLTGDGREIRHLRQIDGQYNYMYCPSGFDPLVTYYTNDPSRRCDVSIVCTNLYTDYQVFPKRDVRVHRKDLVDLLYAHRQEIKFHIYGPEEFQSMYPDCYRGYIEYAECPKVFSNSKINLCIHATSFNNDGNYIYFSERLPQIMGSRGLVYCDTEYDHLLIPGVNYVLADPSDHLKQIKEILANYETSKYRLIKERGYELALKSLTWDVMRGKIRMVDNRLNK
jgi:hypothetical protein